MLAALRWWIGWVAAGGSFIGVTCAVLTILLSREASSRESVKSKKLEEQLCLAINEAERAGGLAKQLKEEVTPRTLSREQTVNLTEALRGFASPVFMECDHLNIEASAYALEFRYLFTQASIPVPTFERTQYPDGRGPRGLGIIVRSDSFVEAGDKLKALMEGCGLSVSGPVVDLSRPNTLTLVIGRK